MNWRIHLALLTSVTMASACGGGGAGDVINSSGENTAGPNLVEPFVGVWQLTSGWSTNASDEALLVIRQPDDDGRATVVLYDFTDETDVNSQCYREPFGNGEAFTSANQQVFLDFSEFANAIVSSNSENTLTIAFDDANDINNNGNTTEQLTTTLTRVDMVESDISPICPEG